MTAGAAFAAGGGRSLIGVGNPAAATVASLGGCPAGSGNAAIATRQLALAIEGSACSSLPKNGYVDATKCLLCESAMMACMYMHVSREL